MKTRKPRKEGNKYRVKKNGKVLANFELCLKRVSNEKRK